MAVNDKFMLPKLVRTMEPMKDLLAAEQAELDQTQRTIAALESQLTISTSTYLLSRHERLFALPANTEESLEARRIKVLAKLNTHGITTVQAVKDLVKIITGMDAEVVEHFAHYMFEILLQNTDRVLNLSALCDALDEIKPAHLLYRYTISIKPFTAALNLGGTMAAMITLPIPEAPDETRWKDTLRIGGAAAMQTVLPVPERI